MWGKEDPWVKPNSSPGVKGGADNEGFNYNNPLDFFFFYKWNYAFSPGDIFYQFFLKDITAYITKKPEFLSLSLSFNMSFVDCTVELISIFLMS